MAMDGYGWLWHAIFRTYAEGNRGQQGFVERVQEDVERIQGEMLTLKPDPGKNQKTHTYIYVYITIYIERER